MPFFLNYLLLLRQNIKKISSFRGEAIWVASGQLGSMVAALGGISFLSRISSPESYGYLALSITILALSMQVTYSPISTAVMRYIGPMLEEKRGKSIVKEIIHIALISSAIVLMLGFILFIVNIYYKIFDYLGIVMVILFVIFSGCSAIITSVMSGLRFRTNVAIVQVSDQVGRYSIASILIFIFGDSGFVLLSGFTVSMGLILILQLYLFYKKTYQIFHVAEELVVEPKASVMKDIFLYAWPFAIWGVFAWMQMVSDRWALQFFTSANIVGQYAVLYQISYVPINLLFSGIILQFIGPIIFGISGNATDPQRLLRVIKIIKLVLLGVFVASIFISFIAFLCYEYISNIFLGPDFRDFSVSIPILILSAGFFSCAQVLSLIPMTLNRPGILIFPKISTAIVGTITNFLFSYYYGLMGAVWSLLLFSILFVIMTLISVWSDFNRK